jgi:5-methylcytosine-specific restriction endonuclease McrA
VRQQVLERDGRSCTICGSSVNLEAHHRLAARDGGRTTLENLVTLCVDCHREAEKRG